MLEHGFETAERTGRAGEITRCLAQLAWARLLLSDVEEADRLAARAEKLLERVTGEAFLFGAHAYAATARVLLATGSPERGEALLGPVVAAADRFGWHEAGAIAQLVLGLCLREHDERDRARSALTRAARLADEHGFLAPAWEAHAALGQQAQASAIIERIAASVNDETLRDRILEQART